MTQSLEVLSRRMATLQSIRGVVRTMKTMSAINAAPYERAAASIEHYHETIYDGLHILLQQSQHGPEPRSSPNAPKVALVFGSDHGLCGSFNETVALAARDRIQADKWIIHAIGARMEAALRHLGLPLAHGFTPPASSDGIVRLAGEILVALDQIRTDVCGAEITVNMFYTQRTGQGRRAIRVDQLLPLDPTFLNGLAARQWTSNSLPTYTMDTGPLFKALIRNHIFASVFRATAESMVTENGARLALMQQAEHALDDRLADLLTSTRSARQSEITNELLDVIAGFEALETNQTACGHRHGR